MTLFNSIINAQEISSQFPFESKFRPIGKGKIHYIDEGIGDPILFLHGVPLSSYSWRNVIPLLKDSSRCIAIDFMGFGESDAAKIDYSFRNQYDYLNAFIDSLQLQNITLVMTDIGAVLGTHYASKHPNNIKGLVFMEAPFGDAETFHKNGGLMQHMMFWMASKDKLGHRLIVKKNMFMKMMGMMTKRKLSKIEREHYKQAFMTEESRTPLFVLPNSFPRKGRSAKTNDMGDFMNSNNEWLQQTELPKLLLYANPGMLVNKKTLKWTQSNINNMQTQYLGKAKHFMEEDLPFEIGYAIKAWYFSLD